MSPMTKLGALGLTIWAFQQNHRPRCAQKQKKGVGEDKDVGVDFRGRRGIRGHRKLVLKDTQC